MNRRPGTLRIIGGRYRSRLVEFDTSDPSLRPTPDRVRQTLYDWLAPRIQGASVLDLFAGSGALGLEALSRGAASVTFVEAGAGQVRMIRGALARLQAEGGQVQLGDALHHLRSTDARYDLVLLDPPYASPLLAQALELLPRVLKPGNRVYLEWPGGRRPQLPAGYAWQREKQAGQVSYGLVSHSGEMG